MTALIHKGDILRDVDLPSFVFSSGQDGARPFKRQTNIVACKHKNIIGKWTRKRKGLERQLRVK